MVDASVVIPCRNGGATLRETLDSIVSQEWERPWEILLADNGSTDDTVAIFDAVAAEHPERIMRRVDAAAYPGKARALNHVIPQAQAPSIILADADDVMSPGWLAAMGAALDAADLVAAASEYRRLNDPWVLEYRLPDPSTREIRTVYEFASQTIPYVSGHCMGFTRRLFDALGGFDETYVVGDDVDFSLRAQLAGFPIRSVPDAVVHYRFRESVPALRRQAHLYAYDQVRLCQRFPEISRPVSDRWKAFRHEGYILARRSTRFLLGREWRDQVERARLAWRWGWYTGLLRGMAAFRAPPPDSGGAGARRVHRATIAEQRPPCAGLTTRVRRRAVARAPGRGSSAGDRSCSHPPRLSSSTRRASPASAASTRPEPRGTIDGSGNTRCSSSRN